MSVSITAQNFDVPDTDTLVYTATEDVTLDFMCVSGAGMIYQIRSDAVHQTVPINAVDLNPNLGDVTTDDEIHVIGSRSGLSFTMAIRVGHGQS